MSRRNELFEYFKSSNSYTAAQSPSAAPGRKRRRSKRTRGRKAKVLRGRALDHVKSLDYSRFTGLPWLSGAAVLLVAVAVVFGSYLIGRSHSESTGSELSTQAPAETPNPKGIEVPASPIYSVLVRTYEDSEENTDLAIDIQENLTGLSYPDVEAVYVPLLEEIRVYIGQASVDDDATLRQCLSRIREHFPEARIVER